MFLITLDRVYNPGQACMCENAKWMKHFNVSEHAQTNKHKQAMKLSFTKSHLIPIHRERSTIVGPADGATHIDPNEPSSVWDCTHNRVYDP